jgi:putative endopeptidase
MKKLFCLCLTAVFFSIWNYSYAQKTGFVDVAGLNPQIKPGDNFFRFVNGRWDDTAKIASDQSGVGSYSFLNIPQNNCCKTSWIVFQELITRWEALSKR